MAHDGSTSPDHHLIGDAIFYGNAVPSFFNDEVTIAVGRNRKDTAFRNVRAPFKKLVADLCNFETGEKDGKNILQGELVEDPAKGGGQRIGANVIRNYDLMVDIDVGMQLEEIEKALRSRNLWAMVWTTSSHLKATSAVQEKALVEYQRQTKAAQIDAALCISFLRDVKHIRPELLDGLTIKDTGPAEGGKAYFVEHKPIPKYRVLLKLSKPFEFMSRNDCTHLEAMQEWKERYAGFCVALGIPYDTSCVDPSHLMYTPRVKKKEAHHKVWVFPGEALDLSQFERVKNTGRKGAGGADPLDAFVTSGGTLKDGSAPQTPNLMKFLAEYADDFEAAHWIEDSRPEWVQQRKSDLIEVECPNAGSHTKQDENGTSAFAIKNASACGDSGFAMWCMHEGCKAASGGDRAWFLDKLCVAMGVKNAMSLRHYCARWVAEGVARNAQIEADERAHFEGKKPDELRARCEALTPESGGTQEMIDVLSVLAAMELETTRAPYLAIISERTGQTLGALKADIKAIQKGQKRRAKEKGKDEAPKWYELGTTEDHINAPGKLDITSLMHIDDRRELPMRKVVKANEKVPRIFCRADGTVVRAVSQMTGENGTKVTRLETLNSDKPWGEVLADHCVFYLIGENNERTVAPFSESITAVQYPAHKPWPAIDGVSNIPLLDADNVLHVEGYNRDMKLLIQPDVPGMLELPDVVTDDHLSWAKDMLLGTAIRDFPFTDDFAGNEIEPVKLAGSVWIDENLNRYTEEEAKKYEAKNDGSWAPLRKILEHNFDRGTSSRAHALAMVIQPHVRHLIKGGCPAYHVDKAAAGTGAGYLVNVAAVIATGFTAVGVDIPNNPEKTARTISGLMSRGDPILFFDNIDYHLNSQAICIALTSGKWKAQVLYEQDFAEFPNNALWVLAGNKLTMDRQMMRRMMPIRMDAELENPDSERGDEMFKVLKHDQWLMRHRAELLLACQVLVRNWLQKGAPRADLTLASFSDYAPVMGGILEAAGVPGFMGNLNAYMGTGGDDDDAVPRQVAQHWWNREKDRWMSATELWDVLKNPMPSMNGVETLAFDIPMKAATDDGRRMALGKWVSARLCKRTFNVTMGAKATRVRCARRMWVGTAQYRLTDVEERLDGAEG